MGRPVIGTKQVSRLLEEISLFRGIDMLLEPNKFFVVQGTHVRHFHFRWLTSAPAIPGVGA
jgi:hypothetical protein